MRDLWRLSPGFQVLYGFRILPWIYPEIVRTHVLLTKLQLLKIACMTGADDHYFYILHSILEKIRVYMPCQTLFVF